jgi:hypothetical protein
VLGVKYVSMLRKCDEGLGDKTVVIANQTAYRVRYRTALVLNGKQLQLTTLSY